MRVVHVSAIVLLDAKNFDGGRGVQKYILYGCVHLCFNSLEISRIQVKLAREIIWQQKTM